MTHSSQRVFGVYDRPNKRACRKQGFRNLLAAAILIPLVLSACASAPQKLSTGSVSVQEVQPEIKKGWWAARFKMNWPEGAEPAWYLDLLLARRVVSPVLQQYKGDVVLWRFHRRASRDQAGHQFSFIFYSSSATARNIYSGIKSDKTLKHLKKAGAVLRDSYDNTQRIAKPHIGDTSDPNWSPNLQKSWPYFIMGVSQTWLDLIELTLPDAGRGKSPSSFKDLKALYTNVNNSIDKLWQAEGGHAFLHHLNAIFGYVPVEVYEKRQMTF